MQDATQRKLAAILSADVVGFSRLMGRDEAGTHARLVTYLEVADRLIAEHGGRTVGTAGDSILADFPSVVAALNAAIKIQQALREQNRTLAQDERLEFRIGINLGDVIVDGDNIFGDGVNVAARVETLCDPNGICVSGKVYEEVKNKLAVSFRDRGSHQVKNIAEPVHVYSVEAQRAAPAPKRASRSKSRTLAIAVGALAIAGTLTLWLMGRPLAPSDSSRRSPAFEQGAPPGELFAKPTIAILPLENQSGEAARSYFSEGVTQDIISALGRFVNVEVMSWDAVARYGTEAPSLDQVMNDLGVRYVVRGSVRRDPARIRVAVRLTDASRGVLLWSERYDKDIDDIFAVQEEITQGIVGALAVRLTSIEHERALAKRTDNLDAYDYVLRGRQHLNRETRSENRKARELFENANELAPDYAEALIGLGWTHNQDAAYGWAEQPKRSLQRAFDLAQEAIKLDPSNSSAHTLLSNTYVHRQRHDLALLEIDRAIELNPSEAEAHGWRGWIMLVLGHTDEAIASSEMALRFNPNGPPSVPGNLGWAYFLEGRQDDAIATLESSLGQHPDIIFAHTALAAAYAALERPNDAARAAANVKRLYPFFEVDPFSRMFLEAEDRRRIAKALYAAGLE